MAGLVIGLLIVLSVAASACAPQATLRSGDEIRAELEEGLDLPPHDGPPAYIAVGPCEDRTGGTGTFTVGDTQVSLDGELGRGMGDMLVSALVNTDRFAVVEANPAVVAALEQQRALRDESEAGIRRMGADLMATCAVTEFEPKASGVTGGAGRLFGRAGRILAGAAAATSTSTVALDIRLVDIETGMILTSFTVEGQARDVSLGGFAAGYFDAAGGLGVFSNTPIEQAIRIALMDAVREIARETPESYFRER